MNDRQVSVHSASTGIADATTRERSVPEVYL